MVKHIKKHLWYYTSFIVIQLLGLWLVLLTAHDKDLQLAVIAFTSIYYIFWALAHQYFHHHLTPKIITEYVLMGSLGMTVALFFLRM